MAAVNVSSVITETVIYAAAVGAVGASFLLLCCAVFAIQHLKRVIGLPSSSVPAPPPRHSSDYRDVSTDNPVSEVAAPAAPQHSSLMDRYLAAATAEDLANDAMWQAENDAEDARLNAKYGVIVPSGVSELIDKTEQQMMQELEHSDAVGLGGDFESLASIEAVAVDPNDKSLWGYDRWALHDEVQRLRAEKG